MLARGDLPKYFRHPWVGRGEDILLRSQPRRLVQQEDHGIDALGEGMLLESRDGFVNTVAA